MIRLHVPDDLAPGPLGLTAEQARYLTLVMRRKLGDDLELFNGRDGAWRARLTEIGRRGCVVAVEARTHVQAFGPDLELVASLVKRGPLETMVEKAAELGARRVRLVTTRRTQGDKANVERLTTIATEAAEQTGRLDVPEIAEPETLEAVLDGWDPMRRLIFCDEGGGAKSMLEAGAGAPAAILIGPEGGVAPEERERLRALAFVTAVSLGPRILRADTAAIVAMGLWQASVGDWRDALPDRT